MGFNVSEGLGSPGVVGGEWDSIIAIENKLD